MWHGWVRDTNCGTTCIHLQFGPHFQTAGALNAVECDVTGELYGGLSITSTRLPKWQILQDMLAIRRTRTFLANRPFWLVTKAAGIEQT
jgi:hypothetical protein